MQERKCEKEFIKHLPNFITISRIISALLAIIIFIKGNVINTIVLYIYSAISDFLNGFIARKFNIFL